MGRFFSREQATETLEVDRRTLDHLVARGYLRRSRGGRFLANQVRSVARLLERCRSIAAIRERRRAEVQERAAWWPVQLRIDAMRLRRDGNDGALAEALERAARIVEQAVPKKP